MGRQNKNRKKKTVKGAKIFIIFGSIVCLAMGLVIGIIGNIYLNLPETYEIPATAAPSTQAVTGDGYSVETIQENELSIHFLELGNKNTGDCTFIKAGDADVLIDAGSKVNSIPVIQRYIDQYCTDGVLEYVIVTHAHEDHYAGFAANAATESIFDLYECRTIIDFAQVTKGKENQRMYQNYRRELAEEVASGAIHYTAKDCIDGVNGASRTFDLGNGVGLEILNSYYYYNVSKTENDHSVCVMINQGEGENAKHYLFTGDLEKDGEEKLVQLNNLPQVELYKAGHHGSKTSSNEALLEVIQPKIVCVCCCAGSSEYTNTPENQFPAQDFINRIAGYTSGVYVTSLCIDYTKNSFTSMNGNIAVCANIADAAPTVYCSNNTAVLKDADWFKKNRVMPAAWAS